MRESVFQINSKKERERGYLTSSVNRIPRSFFLILTFFSHFALSYMWPIIPPGICSMQEQHPTSFLPSLAHLGRKTTLCHYYLSEQHQKCVKPSKLSLCHSQSHFPATPAGSSLSFQTQLWSYPRSFRLRRIGLFTEWRGFRLTLRSWILMFASCSAWACWIPATMAWKDKRVTWCNNTWTVFAMDEKKKRHQNLIYFGDMQEKSGLHEGMHGQN